MNSTGDGSQKWFLYLNVGFLFGATLLRGLNHYWGSLNFYPLISLLGLWLAILLIQPRLSNRYPWFFSVYILIQSILVVALLLLPEVKDETTDYFSILFAILSMQAMLHFKLRYAILTITLFTPLVILSLMFSNTFSEATAFGLTYTAANAIWTAYALATRRSSEARMSNQRLMIDLENTNRQLQSYAEKAEQLSIARERGHLARELHDSVTQTLFSMNLTSQSAILLFEKNPSAVAAQLEHLTQLTNSAISEMQHLISELKPARLLQTDLASAVRQHLAERHFPDGLKFDCIVEGSQPLSAAEEDALYRIAQEAINNIIKHARADWACLHLHLEEPFWMEVEDHGQGFEVPRVVENGKVGLSSMRERAAEIDWNLQVSSKPGTGTCIRVEKGANTRRL